ncbi:lincomycin-condensing protein [Metarhizium robertsii ARSEF 23]|uniref:Lincomycin-condensing protein n=1 Tax=Metarhizium robertsii (strain ARSEF 23 / ATCC MYA-3075) TaxID=655844 RepID=E9F720_METRA|nr:lincomycin-condensing protein [Metarhizium robertsii ARSEF 23]EFY96572.1 lincomycin-condensing protein [Metarhizium robertsii ARSEF 23]
MPPTSSSVYQNADLFKFPSRRSVVHSTDGIVACTQPLAAKCGLDVLRAGGNAADAAVAVAAGLNMTEPCSTGIGGDMFILFWDASAKQVRAMNGSGRAAAKSTLDAVRKRLNIPDDRPDAEIPKTSALAVTVPGAAAGWVDAVERFGSGNVDLKRVLAPAIELGEKGFPVHEEAAHYVRENKTRSSSLRQDSADERMQWGASEARLRQASPNFAEMLKVDPEAQGGVRAPRAGEVMKNPTLARTFRTLAEEGKKGFYQGRIAEELVAVVQSLGGLLELDDLKHHLDVGSEPVEPISLKFHGQGTGHDGGVELWEHPPNGQGIIALMALGIIQELEKQGKIPTFGPQDFNSAPYLHAIIEALRLGFADGSWFVTDPNVTKVPARGLISQEYLAERAKLFDATRAVLTHEHGNPPFASPALSSSDTVYFTVTDAQGNAASFINSNYAGFGTSIIPKGCGFTLQNRGSNFSLNPDHPNKMEPRKRPYHTIIPGMVTNLQDGSLHSSFGVMGGFMQPQGHVQVLLGQLVGRLNPQQALDAPRICIGGGLPESGEAIDWTVNVEEGMPEETIEGLKRLGHKVSVVTGTARGLFGRGQIIRHVVDPVDGTRIWSAGSDMRADGAAYPL